MVTDCGNCPLRDRDTFKGLKDRELDAMRGFKTGEMKIEPGTILLMQGARSPQLFTVLDGLAVRQKTLQNGRRQVTNFVLPGDFLGLQAAVMDEMQHSVEATTKMTLCVFKRSDLWRLFKVQPSLAYDLTWLAAIEEHFLGEALAVIGQLPALQRVAWGLARFYHRAEMTGLVEAGHCPFPFRQQDLADALGLSLVHTNKTLQKLRADRLIGLEDGTLRLLDRDRIAALVEADIVLPEGGRPLL